MDSYISHNGQIIPESKFHINSSNRAFRYGDGFFETIRTRAIEPYFWKTHWKRISFALSLLAMEKDDIFTADYLKDEIGRLIKKAKLFKDNRVRISFWRKHGGLYTPTNNGFEFLIEVTPLADYGYPLNDKGLAIGIHYQFPKSTSKLSLIKSLNCQPLIMAGIYKEKKTWNEVLITNDKGLIIEALSSNIFCIKNNIVITPSLDSGCVDGVMRRQVIDLAVDNRFGVMEVEGLTENTLEDAEEIFITNAIKGIQWVVALGDKRYYYQKARNLSRALNQSISF